MNKFPKSELDKVAIGIWRKEYTLKKLPESLYFFTARELTKGLYKGFRKKLPEGDLKSIKNAAPNFQFGYGDVDMEVLSYLRQNLFLFSAAKTFQEVKSMQEAMTNGKEILTYNKWRDEVEKINEQYNQNWLKAEYDTAISSGQSAASWVKFEKEKKDLPFLRYSTTEGPTVCEICSPLDQMVLPVDDPTWDEVTPPNHFSCFPKGTKVLSPSGWRNIDTIREGDLVIGGSGKPQKVNFVHRKSFTGELRGITIKHGTRKFSTNNHRFLTTKGWKHSENIFPGDIIIQNLESGVFNKCICAINNMHILVCYFLMPFIIKREATPCNTFNGNIQRGDKNINKATIYKFISDTFKSFRGKIIKENFFAWCRRLVKATMFINSKFHFDIKFAHPFRRIGATNAKQRMRIVRLPFIKNFSRLLFPQIISYPSQSHSIGSRTRFHSTIIKNSNQRTIFNFPFFFQIFKRKVSPKIKIGEGFANGAPLDSFNSINSFLLHSFFHRKYKLIISAANVQYFGEIFNLTVDKDESYITEIGVVHNCECLLEQLDEDDGTEQLSSEEEVEEHTTGARENMSTVFMNNPGKTGEVFPADHSYFDVGPAFKTFAEKNFDLPLPEIVENVYTDAKWDIGEGISKSEAVNFAKLAGLPIDYDEMIQVSKTHLTGGRYAIEIKTNSNKGLGNEFNMIRTIDYNNKSIYNNVISLGENSKYNGTEIFKSQIDEATKQGYKKIETTASGEGNEMTTRVAKGQFNGYYTWARLGYVPDKEYETEIGHVISIFNDEHGLDVKNLQELMLTPEGREFWAKFGRSWEGTFDLSEGSYSQKTLADYVKAKKAGVNAEKSVEAKFIPAKTTKEAEKFALENNFAKSVDYSKIPLSYANEINKILLRESSLNLNVPKLDGIGMLKDINKSLGQKYSKYDKLTLAQAKFVGDKKYLAFGESFKDDKSVGEYIKRLTETNTIKELNFDGVLQHEYGHLVDFSNPIDRFTDLSYELMQQVYIEQGDYGALWRNPIKEKVGSYIFTNTKEFFAESYRLWRQGKLPEEMEFVNKFFKDKFGI